MRWRAGAVKIAVFTPAPVARETLAVWSEVFPNSPSNLQPVQGMQSTNIASGPLGDKQAVVTTMPGRTELAFTGVPNSNGPPLPAPFDDIAEALGRLRDLVVGSSLIRDCNRVAVIAELVEPTTGADHSCSLLSSELHLELPPGSTDITFKINQPVDASSDAAIRINRIGTWAAQVGQYIQLQVGPVFSVQASPAVTEAHFVTLELDVNNVPLAGAIANVPGLLDECVAEVLALREDCYARLVRR